MSFNTPITINGDVNTDSLSRPGGYGTLEIGSVSELDNIEILLNESGDMAAYECGDCDEELNEADPRVTLSDGDTDCPDSEDGTHTPKIVPLTWARNIAIDFDEDDDRIDLCIATADPRGGWQMSLWRDHTTGKVMLSVPHADMADPHEPIREIHPGTYEIG